MGFAVLVTGLTCAWAALSQIEAASKFTPSSELPPPAPSGAIRSREERKRRLLLRARAIGSFSFWGWVLGAGCRWFLRLVVPDWSDAGPASLLFGVASGSLVSAFLEWLRERGSKLADEVQDLRSEIVYRDALGRYPQNPAAAAEHLGRELLDRGCSPRRLTELRWAKWRLESEARYRAPTAREPTRAEAEMASVIVLVEQLADEAEQENK